MHDKEKFRIKFAVYLILRQGNEVLISLRQGTGWKDGWFSLVAGHVDGGEPAEQAMIREAKEEIGINILSENLHHVYTMHRISGVPDDEYIDLFFECREWSGKIINQEPLKCGELSWVDVNNLPNNTLEYIKSVVTNYKRGITYSSEAKQ